MGYLLRLLGRAFGKPRIVQMDEGGGWKNDLWVDSCADRYIRLQNQGVGAHPWILERRNELARGIYNRMHADGRYAGRQLISEVQFCLNAALFRPTAPQPISRCSAAIPQISSVGVMRTKIFFLRKTRRFLGNLLLSGNSV